MLLQKSTSDAAPASQGQAAGLAPDDGSIGRVSPPDGNGGRTDWTRLGGRTVPYAGVAVCAVLMFSGRLTDEGVGLTALILMIFLIFAKVPVGIAMISAGVSGAYGIDGGSAAWTLLSEVPFDAVAQWSFTVLPMFIFMGLLLWQSGITERLYEAGKKWLNWLPGGLAIGTNIAGAGMAAVSGSTIGSTYALARIGVPEMLKAGYDRRLAVGSVQVAGLPGQLIPPSITMVIYAGVAETPVGLQLLAGIGPGIFVVVVYSLMTLLLSVGRWSKAGQREERAHNTTSWAERFRSLGGVWLIPALILVVIGGLYSGLFTATESGAVGALVALLATLWTRRHSRPLSAIRQSLMATLESTGSIFILVIGAYVLADMLAVSGIGRAFTDWVGELGAGRVEFLLIMFVAYLILGMVMDPLSMMVLIVPLLIPTLEALDISLLWYGVFAVFMGEIAILTPPVGILLYVMESITKERAVNLGQSIQLKDCIVAQLWFLPVTVLVVCVLIAFPQIATFLPDNMAP